MKSLPFLFLLLLAGFASVYFNRSPTAAPEMARCVDYQDRVVSNDFCQVRAETVRIPGSISPVARYRRYYGGFGSFDTGSTAWGGSDQPLAGHLYRDAAGDNPAASASPETASGFYLDTAHRGN